MRDHGQLMDAVLGALCFNLVTSPSGIAAYTAEVDQILGELDRADPAPRRAEIAGADAGRILERLQLDLLKLYARALFGPDSESELVARRIVPERDGGSALARLTLGQTSQALQRLGEIARDERALGDRLRSLGRSEPELLPRTVRDANGASIETFDLLRRIGELRNRSTHFRPDDQPPTIAEVRDGVGALRGLLAELSAGRFYPDVFRYEGTYENRDGERFVYFVDEQGKERKVRSDERIDPRRHYYCFATNNPVHLHPVLVAKG